MIRVLALLSVITLLFCSGCEKNEPVAQQNDEKLSTYNQASDLLDKGELEKAKELFVQLGDYKDSAERVARFVLLPTRIYAEDDGMGDKIVHYQTDFIYNEHGELIKEVGTYTDTEGPEHSKEFTYDESGKVINARMLSEAGESHISYEYNEKGQLVKFVGFTEGCDLGGITIFTYDEKGNCITVETSSYMGTDVSKYETSEPYSIDRNNYTYNEKGLCVQKSSDTNSLSKYTAEYNSFDLPTKVVYDSGEGFISENLFSYDEQGRCLKIETPNETKSFTYEQGDLPISAVFTRSGGKPCNITYTYQLYYTREKQKSIPFHIYEFSNDLDYKNN